MTSVETLFYALLTFDCKWSLLCLLVLFSVALRNEWGVMCTCSPNLWHGKMYIARRGVNNNNIEIYKIFCNRCAYRNSMISITEHTNKHWRKCLALLFSCVPIVIVGRCGSHHLRIYYLRSSWRWLWNISFCVRRNCIVSKHLKTWWKKNEHQRNRRIQFFFLEKHNWMKIITFNERSVEKSQANLVSSSHIWIQRKRQNRWQSYIHQLLYNLI